MNSTVLINLSHYLASPWSLCSVFPQQQITLFAYWLAINQTFYSQLNHTSTTGMIFAKSAFWMSRVVSSPLPVSEMGRILHVGNGDVDFGAEQCLRVQLNVGLPSCILSWDPISLCLVLLYSIGLWFGYQKYKGFSCGLWSKFNQREWEQTVRYWRGVVWSEGTCLASIKHFLTPLPS